MELPSHLLEEAVEQLASLPGIGRKTALRLTLHLLRRSPDEVQRFGNSFLEMREKVRFCSRCHNLCEEELCRICSSPKRDPKVICVVEDIRDVIALENTQQFYGNYHVLGGIISPMDGIGPSDLQIESLVRRAASSEVQEIILALSSTMEGDTTGFYIYKRIKDYGLKMSVLARGVPIGDDLEYTDEVTLGRSIVNRTPYESSLAR